MWSGQAGMWRLKRTMHLYGTVPPISSDCHYHTRWSIV